jgi:hypothetical protein
MWLNSSTKMHFRDAMKLLVSVLPVGSCYGSFILLFTYRLLLVCCLGLSRHPLAI